MTTDGDYDGLSVLWKDSPSARRKLLPLKNLIAAAVCASPDDSERQLCAQAANDFYREVEDFPECDDQCDEKDGSDSRPRFDHGVCDDSSERKIKRVALPTELMCQTLQYIDGFDFRARQNTFTALTCTCSVLRDLVEPYLYDHPRELDSTDRQWQFLFTLTIKPRLAKLPRSLKLCWRVKKENNPLLLRILSLTSNVETLRLMRGPELHEIRWVEPGDRHFVYSVLDKCSKLTGLTYLTSQESENSDTDVLEWMSGREYHWDAVYTRVPAAKRLTHLSLEGAASWIDTIILPHLSSNLQSLSLKHDLNLGYNNQYLRELAYLCPSLRSLTVVSRNVWPESVFTGMRAWKSTLKSLRLDVNWDENDLEEMNAFEEALQNMSALEDLTLGEHLNCTYGILEALGRSQPSQRLKSIKIGCCERCPPRFRWERERRFRQAISSLFTSHSSTLQEFALLDHDPAHISAEVFRNFKQAKKLNLLWVLPNSDAELSKSDIALMELEGTYKKSEYVQAADVDELLEACPELETFPVHMIEYSPFKERWIERLRRAHGQREEEKGRVRHRSWTELDLSNDENSPSHVEAFETLYDD